MARCRHRTRYPTCQEVEKQKTGRKDLGSPRKRDKTRARVQRCRADPNKVKPNSVTELKNRVKPKSVTELKKKCAGKNRHRVEEGGPKSVTELKKKREAKSMTKQMTVTGLPPGMGQSPRDR